MLQKNKLALLTCFIFFLAYSLLAVIKHFHFLSGYDLAIADQIVWKYSQLKNPITTVQFFPFTSLLTDHVEIIYILLAPFYWIFPTVITLLLLQTFLVALSGLPIYLLSREKKLPQLLSFALLISYLSFYGIQNALWSDVHSIAFAASFLPWFIYFLYKNKPAGIMISLILALFCKEDICLLTFFICFIFFIQTRARIAVIAMGVSLLYLGGVFFVYYPYFTHDGYRYAAPGGILSDIQFSYLYDSREKIDVYLYSLGWFGFLPLFAPLYALPALVDVAQYFVLGHARVASAQGIFLHYRITLALLLVWPTIIFLSKLIKSKYKKYFSVQVLSVYIIGYALIGQYLLHAPLSYLTKGWFWTQPQSVTDIQSMIKEIPANASIVAQVNILPHISHRDLLFTFWPETKQFKKNSPCGNPQCHWARWAGNPEYLIVDTSSDWDIRHFLANREEYIDSLKTLEKAGVIKKYKQQHNAVLYKIQKKSSL